MNYNSFIKPITNTYNKMTVFGKILLLITILLFIMYQKSLSFIIYKCYFITKYLLILKCAQPVIPDQKKNTL